MEYHDLEIALEDMRRVTGTIEAEAPLPPDSHAFHYARLVLHEWIANLMQHAHFPSHPPHLCLRAKADARHFFCALTDNSQGFDLQTHLQRQRQMAPTLPDRGMGLLIIDACTTLCDYRSTPEGYYRFVFSITADHEPWLSTLY